MDNRQNNIKELFTGGKFAIFLMQKNGESTDVALRVCKCNDGFLVNRSCFDFSNVADDLPEIRKAITEPDIKIILTCEEDKTYLVNKFGITTENVLMLQEIANVILQGEALYIIRSLSAVYHQCKALHLIKPQLIQPTADDMRLRR